MMNEELLAGEPERTMNEYRMAWEGEREEDIDLGSSLLRSLAVPWFGVNGLVVQQRYSPEHADQRLQEHMHEEERKGNRYLWIVGPRSQPADLGVRFERLGYVPAVRWDGMILTDLTQDVQGGTDVIVEPLGPDSAEGFARVRSEGFEDPAIYEERLASAHRYLQMQDRHGVHIHVARLGDEVVGHVILRTEPNGVAYFRDAYTLQSARQHGVYLALVARRLQVAREEGCTVGVVQANRETSSPILQKRGWRPVSWLTGYARPASDSTGW